MNQTEQSRSHVETLRARPGGYRDSELFEARRRDEADEQRRQAERQAAMFKENEARSKAREKQAAEDNANRAERTKQLLKAPCGARLVGCTKQAERLVLPSGTLDPLNVPAWGINVVCTACAKRLFLA